MKLAYDVARDSITGHPAASDYPTRRPTLIQNITGAFTLVPNCRNDLLMRPGSDRITLQLLTSNGEQLALIALLGLKKPARIDEARQRERLMSRQLLAELLHMMPSAGPWDIREGPVGPRVESAGGSKRAHCSISHCADGIAVAVSCVGAIGIDIESKLPVNRARVAGHLGDERSANSDQRFLQLWTLWEAFCKLRGRSCLEVPDAFCRDIVDKGSFSGHAVVADDITAAWTRLGPSVIAIVADGVHAGCFLTHQEVIEET